MNQKNTWQTINSLPPIHISNGTMEVIKWLALISMTIDHANRFFFDAHINSAYSIGRLAMPLFAFVFAYNLARPDSYARGLYKQALIRLLIFGILATPAYIAMQHLTGLWPFNILFMFAAATATLYFCMERSIEGYFIALVIFLVSGPFVDYNWIGIFFCITSWIFCKKPSLTNLLLWLLAYFLLGELNGNHWGLLSLAIIMVGTQIDIKLPRIKHFFYYYYLTHLYVLYLLSRTW